MIGDAWSADRSGYGAGSRPERPVVRKPTTSHGRSSAWGGRGAAAAAGSRGAYLPS